MIIRDSPEHRRYMRSRAWKQRREQAVRSAGYRCATCGRLCFDLRKLQVHHISYDRLGEEREGDLMVLCRRCHKVLSKW